MVKDYDVPSKWVGAVEIEYIPVKRAMKIASE